MSLINIIYFHHFCVGVLAFTKQRFSAAQRLCEVASGTENWRAAHAPLTTIQRMRNSAFSVVRRSHHPAPSSSPSTSCQMVAGQCLPTKTIFPTAHLAESRVCTL